MEKIWAPWRKNYIISKKLFKGCIFCTKPKAKKDKLKLILERGKYCFSMMNIFPYNNGHLMIAPYRHIKNLEDLKPKEKDEILDLLIRTKKLLEKALRPHGFNVGINLGKVAGAGFERHLHIHIVPRWQGDTNFMPILGKTKVIPQSLGSLYAELRKALKSL